MRSQERQAFPGREVDIPDVDRYELDLEVGGASVAGVVTDRDTGAPLPEAQVSLRLPGPDGEWKGGGASGPDGRFTIATEPGEYVLVASARGRRPARMPLSVGTSGVPDVRVEMEPGLEVRGRILSADGRPAPDVFVVAVDADAGVVGPLTGQGRSLPDGTFRVGGLEAKPYTLLAGGFGDAGYAVRGGATPGDEPVALTLRPGGRATVRVLGPDGAAVRDVWPRVAAWDGVRASALPGADARPADAPGVYDMRVPAGTVEIEAGAGGKPLGRATVRVAAGRTTPVDLVLREPPPR
jgi:hypothetical protein